MTLKGEWSDPVFLPEVGGIDPGFLFDEDGKSYIVNNDAPAEKPEYSGHRAIWIREFDWKNNRTVGDKSDYRRRCRQIRNIPVG